MPTLGGGSDGAKTYTFAGAIRDPVVERLLGLWYGWAAYYDKYVRSKNPLTPTVELDKPLDTVGVKTTFSFFGPVHLTGTIDPTSPTAKTWITGLDPNVVTVLKATTVNNPLSAANLSIIGPGVPGGAKMTFNFTQNRIELNVPLLSGQMKGTFRFKNP